MAGHPEETRIDFFISYAKPDVESARELNLALTNLEQRVFIDEKIAGGEPWNTALNDALGSAKTIVVLISKHSKQAEGQRAEIARALDLPNAKIVPVMLDGWLSFRRNAPKGLLELHAVAWEDPRLVAFSLISGLGKAMVTRRAARISITVAVALTIATVFLVAMIGMVVVRAKLGDTAALFPEFGRGFLMQNSIESDDLEESFEVCDDKCPAGLETSLKLKTQLDKNGHSVLGFWKLGIIDPALPYAEADLSLGDIVLDARVKDGARFEVALSDDRRAKLVFYCDPPDERATSFVIPQARLRRRNQGTFRAGHIRFFTVGFSNASTEAVGPFEMSLFRIQLEQNPKGQRCQPSGCDERVNQVFPHFECGTFNKNQANTNGSLTYSLPPCDADCRFGATRALDMSVNMDETGYGTIVLGRTDSTLDLRWHLLRVALRMPKSRAPFEMSVTDDDGTVLFFDCEAPASDAIQEYGLDMNDRATLARRECPALRADHVRQLSIGFAHSSQSGGGPHAMRVAGFAVVPGGLAQPVGRCVPRCKRSE